MVIIYKLKSPSLSNYNRLSLDLHTYDTKNGDDIDWNSLLKGYDIKNVLHYIISCQNKKRLEENSIIRNLDLKRVFMVRDRC